jgi:adenine C2-methylase RlmN of 23S rRNA A2503 and tRNA A37
MGEPAHNLDNVLYTIKNLNNISNDMSRCFNWLPCFNSILPRKVSGGLTGFDVIDEVLAMKEHIYKGFLHFQVSCNSTDEETRTKLFGGADILSLEEIINYINKKSITNRTVTLNFIVMKGIEVDVNKLKKMGLCKNNFTIKLIPLNNTINAQINKLNTFANYDNYADLQELGDKFNSIGVPTVIDTIAKCEEAGLCCGQLAQIYVNKSV